MSDSDMFAVLEGSNAKIAGSNVALSVDVCQRFSVCCPMETREALNVAIV
jgi:hypothetical protein